MTENPVNRIMDRNAEIREIAANIDTTRTETVKIGDLRSGDVILSVGPNDAQTYPFPFTVSRALHLTKYGKTTLTFTHGGFTGSALPSSDPAVIVAR